MIYGWTKDMDNVLRRMAATGRSSGVAAQQLKMTRSAVMGRAYRLGIQFQSVKHKPWTARHTRYLCENYPTKTASEIADKLGRTVQSVKAQRRKLGLTKRRAS